MEIERHRCSSPTIGKPHGVQTITTKPDVGSDGAPVASSGCAEKMEDPTFPMIEGEVDSDVIDRVRMFPMRIPRGAIDRSGVPGGHRTSPEPDRHESPFPILRKTIVVTPLVRSGNREIVEMIVRRGEDVEHDEWRA